MISVLNHNPKCGGDDTVDIEDEEDTADLLDIVDDDNI
jgi:hypothetical protein